MEKLNPSVQVHRPLSKRVRLAPGQGKWIAFTFLVVILLGTASFLSVQRVVAPVSPPELAVSSLDRLVVNARQNSVIFIYPDADKNRTKPLGVEYPDEEDFSLYIIAGGIIFGMTKNPQVSTTDATSYMNHESGKPLFDGTIVIIGNSKTNGAARYYETSGQTPVLFDEDQASLQVLSSNGTIMQSTKVEKKGLRVSGSDLFVAELFRDTDGRNVVMIWGYAGRGAVSAARVVKFEILEKPQQYSAGFYVGKWTDAAEGGSKNNIPDQGDNYEILHTGPALAASKGFSVGWAEISGIYTAGFALMGVGLVIRRGWIRIERRQP